MKRLIKSIKKIIWSFFNKDKRTHVSNYKELFKALKNGKKEIVLDKNISCEAPLLIDKDVTIDCQNREIQCYQERQGFSCDYYLVNIAKNTKFNIALSRVEHEDGSEVKQSETGKGIFRVKIKTPELCPYNYINISCGWTAYTFPIIKIENGYVYFRSYGTDYCVDFDWYQGNSHKFTEYKLLYCSNLKDAKYVLDIKDCYVTIKNGSIKGGIKAENSNFTLSISNLRNCSEYGVYAINSTVIINDTTFEYTWKSAIKCVKGLLKVDSCCFRDVNQGRQNTGAVDTDGNCHIYDNDFINYGSFGIRAGKVKAKTINDCPNTFIIQNRFDTDVNQGVVTDTGAIYLAANNDLAMIRDNIIIDYQGRDNNHAIYCDDGAYNFEVSGNRIIGCLNGYAISSRCADPSKTQRGYAGGIPNTNRLIKDNYCESGIWFGGNADVEDNKCIFQDNIIHEFTEFKTKLQNVKIINSKK